MLLAAGFEHHQPFGEVAALQQQQKQEELYVLPEGNMAELAEFRRGL